MIVIKAIEPSQQNVDVTTDKKKLTEINSILLTLHKTAKEKWGKSLSVCIK